MPTTLLNYLPPPPCAEATSPTNLLCWIFAVDFLGLTLILAPLTLLWFVLMLLSPNAPTEDLLATLTITCGTFAIGSTAIFLYLLNRLFNPSQPPHRKPRKPPLGGFSLSQSMLH